MIYDIMLLSALFGGALGMHREDTERRSAATAQRLHLAVNSGGRPGQSQVGNSSPPVVHPDPTNVMQNGGEVFSSIPYGGEMRYFPAYVDHKGDQIDTQPKVEHNGWIYQTVQIRYPAFQPPSKDPEDEKSSDAEKELARRLERQGRSINECRINLEWNDLSDLDLYLRCPDGKEIFYNDRARAGFELDVDMNVTGIVIPGAKKPLNSATPVESIELKNRQGALPGVYTISVHNYHNREYQQHNFTITVGINGLETKRIQGTIGGTNTWVKDIYSFRLKEDELLEAQVDQTENTQTNVRRHAARSTQPREYRLNFGVDGVSDRKPASVRFTSFGTLEYKTDGCVKWNTLKLKDLVDCNTRLLTQNKTAAIFVLMTSESPSKNSSYSMKPLKYRNWEFCEFLEEFAKRCKRITRVSEIGKRLEYSPREWKVNTCMTHPKIWMLKGEKEVFGEHKELLLALHSTHDRVVITDSKWNFSSKHYILCSSSGGYTWNSVFDGDIKYAEYTYQDERVRFRMATDEDKSAFQDFAEVYRLCSGMKYSPSLREEFEKVYNNVME